jgi:NDP-sugar pyrophosphorylase family protein
MENKPLQAVILAAGESSRFWPLNARHKSLMKIMGKPLVWYTIEGLRHAGVEDIVVVQGPTRDMEEELKNYPELGSLSYAVQPEANGMSGAMMAAKDLIKGQFFVVHAHSVECQDVCTKMLEKSRQTGAKMVLVGQETAEPWLYGVARLEGDRVFEVVEKPEQGKEPSNIKVSGIYLLDNRYIEYLEKVTGKVHFNIEFEAALTAYAKENDSRFLVMDKDYKGVSLKYPWHLFKVQKYLFNNYLTKQRISQTAQIAKNAVIEGSVLIGENARVCEGAVVKGPCYIGDDVLIGTNSVVRDYCDIEAKSIVGALSEVTRTVLQPDTHIHSGYFGDSILASGVRVGAGAITANLRIDREPVTARVKKEKNGVKVLSKVDTGLKTLGVIIGENSKLGVRVTTMPARFIGKNCTIGPATIVMRNVDDGSTIK